MSRSESSAEQELDRLNDSAFDAAGVDLKGFGKWNCLAA